MNIKHVANFARGCQDGAIWNNTFFALNAKGECKVYDLSHIGGNEPVELKEIGAFVLDKAELIVPHSNSVVFGKERFSPDDEFPLMYSNIYNNYSNEEDRMVGVCLVYRIEKNGNSYFSTLVQIIETGFADNSDYWCSEDGDIRPYGNFVVDRENSKYYAFTMRDGTHTTRYFAFELPKLSDGVADSKYGVNRVTLNIEDIKEYFDCEYHNFIQGACFHNGKVYSVEGFSISSGKAPALRVIDVAAKKQETHVKFADFNLDIEPEMIDFSGDTCYYSDGHGHMYKIEF